MKRLLSGILAVSLQIGYVGPFLHLMSMDIFATLRSAMSSMEVENESGLKFRLSDGDAEASAIGQRDRTEGQPISDADAGKLLGRAEPLPEDQEESATFKLRSDSLPAPKTGERNQVSFPRIGEGLPQPQTDTAPLSIVRFSPEGEVGLVSELFVTFSEPMVPVGSQQETASYVPAQLTPSVQGSWRWLGTRTLVFKADKRFPMSTDLMVSIPQGARTATGKTLSKSFSWNFRTESPKVIEFTPPASGVSKLNPLMVVRFDQDVDESNVLSLIRVSVGAKQFPVRLATDEEIRGDEYAKAKYSENAGKRMVAFRIDATKAGSEKFPMNATVDVVIGKGIRSLEGPRSSTRDFNFSFTTHGALKLGESRCGWGGECRPNMPILVDFNNRLDADSISGGMVVADPPIEGMKVTPSYRGLQISGIKKPRRTLRMKIDGRIRDEFGQTLGEDAYLEFKIGGQDSDVFTSGWNLITIDPHMKTPRYSFHSINVPSVRVRMRSVRPEDWESYRSFLRNRYGSERKDLKLPGRIVFDKTVNIRTVPDEIVRTDLDLASALRNGLGHLILEIERDDKGGAHRFISWVQVTRLGIDAFIDDQEAVAYVSDLKSGRPVKGASVSIDAGGKKIAAVDARDSGGYIWGMWNWVVSLGSSLVSSGESSKSNLTDADGIARLDLPINSSVADTILLAESGADSAFVPSSTEYFWVDPDGWSRKASVDEIKWFVFDDRNIYRPGEEVSFKGYVRAVGMGKGGDITPVGSLRSLSYSVTDSRGVKVASGKANFNSFGAFDFNLKLPDNLNLGRATLSVGREEGKVEHALSFEVQEFRRPEFEVESRVVTEAPHMVGSSARVMTSAKYFAGGGLADSQVSWVVTSKPTRYSPPNRDDFSFGTWIPWWRSSSHDGSTNRQTYSGTTDANGDDFLKVDFESASPARPYSVDISSAVADVNRQVFSSSTSMLVHPSSLYVGLKTSRSFVEKGKKFNVQSIVTDIDGNLLSGKNISLVAILKDWNFKNGNWVEEVVDTQECNVISGDEVATCSFLAKSGGQYGILARIVDEKGRPNESELKVWVPGGNVVPAAENVEGEDVEMIPSKSEYSPGETAEILVNSPFGPAEGILTLRRGGILTTERFKIAESSAVVRIPIEEAHIPNAFAHVRLVGSSKRAKDGVPDDSAPTRPAFATGTIELKISAASRRLTVEAVPDSASSVPGSNTKVEVTVKDSSGAPVSGSEVALVVVDESVLSLTGYRIPDPLSIFYPSRASGTRDYDSRSTILLASDAGTDSSDMEGARVMAEVPMPAPPSISMMRMMSEAPSESGNQSSIRTRVNFNPLAVFVPGSVTDLNGKVTAEFKLPDNLTRYRITAVAVDDLRRFGKGESNLTVRQPLMVRPSAPRFANFGDSFDVPVVIQNQTEESVTVDVAMRATNLKMTGPIGQRVVIPANDRVELRFPVETVRAGTSRIQFVATSGNFSDATSISIPIYTPATTEAFATYGSLDSQTPLFQPVTVPSDIFEEFGELEVSVSSTQLQELTDAFLYLYRYPFECTEQISSRMMSVGALRDVLGEFKSNDIPKPEEIEKSFENDINALLKRQRPDGSFGMWTVNRERYEFPFVSIHAAHALAIAKAKGYKVPAGAISRSNDYLRNIESKMDSIHSGNAMVRLTLSAYALHVRGLLEDRDVAKARTILSENELSSIPFEAIGWLLGTIADDSSSREEVSKIKRFLMNRVSETASTANFTTGFSEDGYLVMYSNRRADGVLLDTLLRIEPGNDLIPKLVKGLLAQRKKGAWSSTQENVFILLAMDRYFKAYEGVTPDFVAKMWYGTAYGGELKFSGRSTRTDFMRIPMQELLARGRNSNLILQRDGKGRLYYRVGMKYAPLSLKQEAADYGFEVSRSYEAVDNPADVVREADGTWSIKAGARVRVKLQMSNGARRYHVALVDKLPAGFEVLNPGLAVTEDIPTGDDSQSLSWWRRNWYEHRNLRDERVEAFASLLYGGVYDYSYIVRATTPGKFIAPAAKAEEMYSPETFGRSSSDTVIIK